MHAIVINLAATQATKEWVTVIMQVAGIHHLMKGIDKWLSDTCISLE